MQYPYQRDSRGRKPTCLCGECGTCRKRAYRRDYARGYYHGERRPRTFKGRRQWTPEEDALLGTDVDRVIAERIGTTTSAVGNRRSVLGIERFRGRHYKEDGYVVVGLSRDDPFVERARSGQRMLEHRLVMARHLGRPLRRDEFVHHRNGIRHDNRIENLELWTRSHPDGQRVEDVYSWCCDFIARYQDAHGHLQLPFFTKEIPV